MSVVSPALQQTWATPRQRLSPRRVLLNHFGQLTASRLAPMNQHGLGKNKSRQYYGTTTPYAENRKLLHRLWTPEGTEPSSGTANWSIVLFRCAEMTQPRSAPNPGYTQPT